MLARGLKQRQIGLRLGISQTRVWEIKRDLSAAGRLPAPGIVVMLPSVNDDDDDAAPTVRRRRSEILLEHATLKAATLRTTTRTLLDHVVNADEWVTEPGYADSVRAATAAAVSDALDHLDQIAKELGLARNSASTGRRS